MAQTWFYLLVIAAHVVPMQSAKGKLIISIIGDSVRLSTSTDCTGGEELKRVTGLHSVTVAKCEAGVWKAGPEYEDRIKHDSPCSVNLTNVNYNDKGLYEFSSEPVPVELEVLVPVNLSVTVGDRATLPGHAFTAGADPVQMRWERAEQLVSERNISSGPTTAGPGFNGRVNLSSDWHVTGDLSLTLEGVQQEDQGLFMCYVVGKDGTRTWCAAVRLQVSPRTAEPECTTHGATEEKKMGTVAIVSLIFNGILILVVLVLIVILVVLYLRTRTRNASRGEPSRDEAATEMETFIDGRSPANGGPSRPNSNSV